MLGAGLGGLWMFSGLLSRDLLQAFRASLAFEPQAAMSASAMLRHAGAVLALGLGALLPWLAGMLVAAFVAPLLVGGWLFSTEALAPQFSRLDPLQGLKRMVSVNSLSELGKSLAKAALIGGVAAWALYRQVPPLLALLQEPLGVALPAALGLVGLTCALVTASLVVVVLIDVPWQLWTHHHKLRMTLEEVKKEHKESEGDPHIKAQIRRQRQLMAKRRMMVEVPKADVVLTNPTHYAVALRHEESAMRAPRVVAKGRDAVAERIRALAAQSRVPLLEAPPLARALYKHSALGEEIPGALYTAVAEVLAWSFQLRRAGLGEQPPRPTGLAVPPEMDPNNRASAAQGAHSTEAAA